MGIKITNIVTLSVTQSYGIITPALQESVNKLLLNPERVVVVLGDSVWIAMVYTAFNRAGLIGGTGSQNNFVLVSSEDIQTVEWPWTACDDGNFEFKNIELIFKSGQ